MNKKNLEGPQIYSKGGKTGVLILHGFTGNISKTDILFRYLKSKGFTVARPALLGHSGKKEDFEKYGPKDWVDDAKKWIDSLNQEVEKLYLITISFGGSIATSICTDDAYKHKIKGAVIMEMPVFFRLKIDLLLNFVQPILQFLGIKTISKNKFIYRGGYKKTKEVDSMRFLPIKATGLVRDFVKETIKKFKNFSTPCLIVYSQKSDLLKDNNGEYIYNNISSREKELYYVPINNHDLNLLDDAGKMLLLEKIYRFIEKKK